MAFCPRVSPRQRWMRPSQRWPKGHKRCVLTWPKRPFGSEIPRWTSHLMRFGSKNWSMGGTTSIWPVIISRPLRRSEHSMCKAHRGPYQSNRPISGARGGTPFRSNTGHDRPKGVGGTIHEYQSFEATNKLFLGRKHLARDKYLMWIQHSLNLFEECYCMLRLPKST